ncbi:MAG: four helix bundle protein [Patescibacteria group bacterium]
MESYRDLIVWQKGIRLVSEIYKLTEKFPKNEIFGLTSQTRRAAVSIPANLAEGYARKHRAEYAQFVKIAFGSGAELETHLLIAQNLGFVDKQDVVEAGALLDEVMRMLNKLSASLAAKP